MEVFRKVTIRQEENTTIGLCLYPDNYYLRTHFIEPGFESVENSEWIYRTPFVYDMNARRWEINYRDGEEWIPHLTRAEAARCAELIDEFENELPF